MKKLVPVAVVCLALVSSQQVSQFSQIPTLTPEQQEILSHMSIVYLDDGQGGLSKTIRFEGVNVQIVNGLGATNGNPGAPSAVVASTAVNGFGNLIVGYNEAFSGADRTGSHNIVGGLFASYSSFGGIVGGRNNTVAAPSATAVAGAGNRATGLFASVTGGYNNEAAAYMSSVSGGGNNLAAFEYSSILGGNANTTLGGSAVVCGGELNVAGGNLAAVSGGEQNQATGYGSAVSGGRGRIAPGLDNWAAGSLLENQ